MNQHTPLAWSPRLLLPGLLLLLLPDCAKAASSVTVQVLTNVTGILNESTTLVCNLMSTENVTVTQVTWMKKNPDGSRPTVAVFHPTKGPSIPDSERVKFWAPKLDGHPWNASLAISHVQAKDEGSYECQFATFPTGSRSNSVHLRVLDPPEVSISGYDEEWPEGLTEVALSCDAQSKPEPTDYAWSTTTGPLPNNTEAQGNRLLIHKVSKTTINNVTFVCNVTNALGSGQNQVTVHVKEPMSSGLSTAAIGIIISISISIFALLIFIVIGTLCYFRSRRSRSNSKSNSRPSAETAYSPVNNNINSTQDIEMNSINSHDQRT